MTVCGATGWKEVFRVNSISGLSFSRPAEAELEEADVVALSAVC